MGLIQIIPVVLQAVLVASPVFVHLHEELQEDGFLEELLDIGSCQRAHALQRRARLADDNALLALALHIDDGTYADDAFLMLLGGFLVVEGLDLHLHAVRDLLVVVEQDFLTDNLIYEEAGRLVGQLVFGEERRALGQRVADGVEELRHAELLARRDREDRCLGQQPLPKGNQLLQGLLRGEVYLVDDKEDPRPRRRHLFHLVKEIGIAVGVVLHIGYIEQDIGVHKCGAGELQHLLLQAVVGLEHARGVGIDHLEVVAVDDTHDTMARGLRLGSDNRQPLAHQRVHQRGLAHVGITHDIYKTRFMHTNNFFAKYILVLFT